ncbi:MAG TPA: S41 family peptidase [Allosphingosinicella sp.]|nr:S41 family peptidase [Allosphingosinicella sp.]
MSLRNKSFILRSAIAMAGMLPLSGVSAHIGQASAPPAAAAEARIAPEAIRSDFAFLYDHLKAAHYDLFARVSRRSYDRLYAAMLREMRAPETRAEVGRRFQRFVAFGRVAHARIDENYRSYRAYLDGGGRTFPLSLRIRGGRAFIAASHGFGGVAPGNEILRIAGRTPAAWIAAAHRNISADTDYMASALLDLDLPMLIWLELGPLPEIEISIRRRDGSTAQMRLACRTRAEIEAAGRNEAPRLNLAASDRTARMVAGDIAYLRPGAFFNADPGAADPYDNSSFRQFIDRAFAQFLADGAQALIVDLRDNPGGDSSFSDLMVSWFANRPYRFASAFRIRVSEETTASNLRRLQASGGGADSISGRFASLYAGARPGQIVEFPVSEAQPRATPRFAGRVFVLVNRNSYSNAVAVAATIQDYRFGTVIGEETSDLATTYGAMETFALPRTSLQVGYPKAYIVRPGGGIAPRGVVPDIAIETPVVEGPEDPVLQRAIALARPAAR